MYTIVQTKNGYQEKPLEQVRRETLELTEQEIRLLKLLRTVEYGEVRVLVQAGVPLRVEEIRKSIKL